MTHDYKGIADDLDPDYVDGGGWCLWFASYQDAETAIKALRLAEKVTGETSLMMVEEGEAEINRILEFEDPRMSHKLHRLFKAMIAQAEKEVGDE